MLLEGYDYTAAFASWLTPTHAAIMELQRRLSLLDRIYRDASAAAIEEARRRYGVDYILADRRDDLPYRSLPASAARLVFSDSEIPDLRRRPMTFDDRPDERDHVLDRLGIGPKGL